MTISRPRGARSLSGKAAGPALAVPQVVARRMARLALANAGHLARTRMR